MRDVSDWLFLGHGEMSTLPKEDLLSPDGKIYVMKYPRPFDGKRVNWEDVNEVVASEILNIIGFKHIKSEIAFRNNNRGCLMEHFIVSYSAEHGDVAASLLASELGTDYKRLQNFKAPSKELTKQSFSLMKKFSYFEKIKFDYIFMNIFDILIGNQDRHPMNWQILFKEDDFFMGPLYDNGASLGWQLSDGQLKIMLENEQKMNSYFLRTKVKAGFFENTSPPLKALDVIEYLSLHYQNEIFKIVNKLKTFNWDQYRLFIKQLPLISDVRKEFLVRFVEYRLEKIIEMLEGKSD